MAQKRMFDKTITNSDDFREMPATTQNLYFHLSMNADDDGFLNDWRGIMKILGSREDDLKLLIAKSYIIPFESGVIVIKHWRINNFLRKDRYKETNFKEELSQLTLNDNQEYVWLTNGQPSIDKNSIYSCSSYNKNNNILEDNRDNRVIGEEEKEETLYDYAEENFNRTLSPIEIQKIDEWAKDFNEDMIKYAINLSVLGNKKTFKYVDGILKNWKSSGYKSIEEIKDNDKPKKRTNKQELFDYDWLNDTDMP